MRHCWRDRVARQPAASGPGERGANLIEYALLIALIVVVCLAAVTRFGQTVPASSFTSIANSI